MNITILDDYQNFVRTLACFSKVTGHHVTIWNDYTKNVEVLADRLKDTEALVLIRERTPITADLLRRLKKLRVISQYGQYPHIDVEACSSNGVILSARMGSSRTPSYATAELNWGLTIAALRHIPQENYSTKAGKWQTSPIGTVMRGKTLGVYAYGEIGTVVAGYGKAFGMNVLVWGRETSLTNARKDGYAVAASREAFFEQSDIVSLHIPLLPDTRGIITAADLARAKPTALLVNTSRAGIIGPGVLAAALRAGRPAMAAVDVFEEEPVGLNDPLLAMDNVICTPHLGYVERNQLESMFSAMFDQVLAYAGGNPINVVNPKVLDVGQPKN